jgi:hypothetical protein
MTIVLKRTALLGLKIEENEGVGESLGDADFAGNRKEVSAKYTPGEYERGLMQGSLSRRPLLKGTLMGPVSWQEELVGGSAGTEPKWGEGLRGCGFAVAATVKKISLGAVSGDPGAAFDTGQVVGNHAVLGSATKTVRVVAFVAGSPNILVYEPLTGSALADTDTLYNYETPQASAAVASSATPVAAGRVYTPLTETVGSAPPSLTVHCWQGGEMHRFVGCRGNATLSMRVNEPALLRVEVQGAPILESDGNPLEAARPAPGAVGVPPLIAKGLPASFDGHEPVITGYELGLNTTVTPRPTVTGSTPGDSGYKGFRITDRDIKAAIDPEYSPDWESVKKTLQTVTFPHYVRYGSPTHGNGMLVVWAPSAQLNGEIDLSQERDGIVTQNADMLLTGTQDDEVRIYHVFI